MEMASYILSILRAQLAITLSWGFHSPVALENGLQFQVNGYLFSGNVRIVYVDGLDLFKVQLIKDGVIQTEVTEVYLDCLVAVVDGLVERCPNYEERIKKDYQFNLK